MRKYYRNWITYNQAYGKDNCIPHKRPIPPCPPGGNLCCDMLSCACRRFIEQYEFYRRHPYPLHKFPECKYHCQGRRVHPINVRPCPISQRFH